jgi:protein subunit release factor A
MKSSLRTKLDALARRLDELDAMLSSEDAVRDLDRYRALTMERRVPGWTPLGITGVPEKQQR